MSCPTLSRLLLIAGLSLCAQAGGGNDGVTTLDVDGESVHIVRDAFGIPHVFGDTNRGLFTAFGYAVAQDRLWQLEMNRRASQGRLAEIFGKQPLTGDFLGVPDTGAVTADVADQNARTFGYADDEIDQQFADLPAEEQGIVTAFVDGINRHLSEISLNPALMLPFEFQHLGLTVPEPWSVRDAVRFFAFVARLFGDAGGGERANQTLFNNLLTIAVSNGYADPNAAAVGMFDDLRWFNDPEAPTTVPSEGAVGKRQKAAQPQPAQLAGASEQATEWSDENAKAVWHALGIPTGIGSYGWTVSAARSTTGTPLFLGAPGLGFNAPEVLHEVQLTGGNGFHVTGATLAGLPVIVVGRTDRTAWTLMTPPADNVDTYVETLCNGGNGYLFNGACTPYDTRLEVISIKGSAPINLTVRRSVHGPVVASTASVRFARRRLQWQHELADLGVSLGFMRARSLEAFRAFAEQRLGATHLLYADNSGNIAFWMAGWIPVRPSGFDTRFPLPGDGSAEWTAERMPIPFSINPARGVLANWNNKASDDSDMSEGGVSGRMNRILEITAQLDGIARVSPDDMRHIVRDVARVDVTPGTAGRQARVLKPYFLAALDAVPPTHALASQARTILESWDGSALADAVSSTTLEPGWVILNRWRTTVLQNTFGDELKAVVSQATVGVLLHALDDALRVDGPCADLGGSCVPPSRDYFNGVDPNVVMSNAFDQALTALGSDPAAWSNQPRPQILFSHYVVGPIAQVPAFSRMTWLQHVLLAHPANTAESIITLGQSGFIGVGPDGTAVLSPHFADQLPLYRNFEYKPMNLCRSWTSCR